MRRALQISLILPLFFLARSVIAQDTSELQSFSFEPDSKRPHISIQVVAPKLLSTGSLKQNVQNAFHFVEGVFQIPFRDSFEIYFDPGPDFHNGLTTVVPRNRILVHLEPPEIEETIGLYRDFVYETLVHELAHLIVMQTRGGVFSTLDFVVGNSSRPLGLWPRWMHEGLAVWTEARIGGRKNSGWVDFDLKKIGNYFKSAERFPIDTTVLDGQKELQTIDAGDLPYHFGSTLFGRVADKLGPEGLKNFLLASGKNLGLSYRVVLRDQFGVDLNQEFENLSHELKSFQPPTDALDESKFTNLAKAKKILGPIRTTTQQKSFISWIEFGGGLEPHPIVNVWPQGESILKFPWKLSFSQPKAVLPIKNTKALVLFRQNPNLKNGAWVNPKSPTRAFVGIANLETSQLECTIEGPQSPREISIFENKMTWIEKTKEFKPAIKIAKFNPDSCELTEISTILEGDFSFQRFSGLSLTSDSVIYSKSQFAKNPGDFWEFPQIINLNSNAQNGSGITQFPTTTPWTYLEILDKNQNSFLLTQFASNQFAPGILVKKEKTYELKTLNLATGSTRSTVSHNVDKILVKIGNFSEEVIKEIPVTEFKTPKPVALNSASDLSPSPNLLTIQKDETPLEYSASSTLWPQFWVPMLQATTGGFIFLGETFYEDVTKKYSGSTGLGFETFSNRPYFRTQLGISSLGWGPFHTLSSSLFFSSATAVDPNENEILIQDRFGGSAGFSSTYVFRGPGLRFETLLGLGAIKASQENTLEGFTYVFPVFSFSITSKRGLRNRAGFYDPVGAKSGWALDQSFRFFKGHDSYTNIQGQIGLLGSTALHGQVEYGSTDIRNYPAAFFEVGGLQGFNLFTPVFLTRGFDYRILASREVVRLATELAFPIFQESLFRSNWNRLALDKVQGRLIFETITYSSYRTARMGDRYLSSFGGIVDFWGSGLHYLEFTLGFGAFKGFGSFGETKFFLNLSSGLNI